MSDSELPQDLANLLAELRLIAAGDQAKLLLDLLPRLRLIARRFLPQGSSLRIELDSEDLVQEGLLNLVRNIDSFQGTSWQEFLAFVSKIMEQRAVRQARRATIRKGEWQGEEGVDQCPSTEPRPSVDAMANEELQRVARLVEQLPEPYRTAMRLRIAGMSNEDIARRLGEEEPAVRQRLARAVRMLQESW